MIMDYEKKYNELVGKIEKAYLYAQTDSTKAVLEEIRPELAESEEERIRKELIELIGCMHDADPRKKDWLTWLEKQAPKPKGSKEDEEMLSEITTDVKFAQDRNPQTQK